MAASLHYSIALGLALCVCIIAAKEQAFGVLDENSCFGRCPGDSGEGLAGECSCDKTCMKNANCCYDYFAICHSGVIPTCKGMCEVARTPERPCDCSPACIEFDDCCPDHNEMCLMDTVTDEELEDMAESLLFWEEQSMWELLDINLNDQINETKCVNKPGLPSLLNFKEDVSKFSMTYEHLHNLYNDFNPDITSEEVITSSKLVDQSFLSGSILETRLMKAVYNFLVKKQFVPKETVFRKKFQTMWLDTYQRSNKSAPHSSSGIEHVFLGEIEPGKETKGFHNWLYLMNEQSNAALEYYGYFEYLQLNKKASVISINFKWRNHCKPQSSMFIGTSPEFEFALYTLCWFTRPNRLCPVVLGGHRLSIQTYVHINHYGSKFVAAAYPDLSGTTILTSSKFILGFTFLHSIVTFYFTMF